MQHFKLYRQLQALPRQLRVQAIMRHSTLSESEAMDYISWLWDSFYKPPRPDEQDDSASLYVTQINQVVNNTLNLHLSGATEQVGHGGE